MSVDGSAFSTNPVGSPLGLTGGGYHELLVGFDLFEPSGKVGGLVTDHRRLNPGIRAKERGGHFRDDYPAKDPACGTFNVVSYRGQDGKMHIRREPVKPMPAELTAIIEENK